MNIALVYDRVNKIGGAERVLLALHDIWPDAPLFTAVYDSKGASWANVFRVIPSFLQHIPFARRHHEFFPWLTPMAFGSFSFDDYDVVLSVTSAEAKNVITKPGTVHICYCLTPTRYLWSGQKEYEGSGIAGGMLRVFAPMLRKWDIIASSRPDYYIAISKHVEDRIGKYYQRKVENVIYPPVDMDKFRIHEKPEMKSDAYFLCVSRLVPYKRVDILIQAFNKTGEKLIVVGTGSQKSYLESIAEKNITVAGDLTDADLVAYYQRCAALVFAGDEDFGIVSLEAQACGKPVICYRGSGMAETVIEGKTGELVDKQSADELAAVIERFDPLRYDSGLCRRNAQRFSGEHFKNEMKKAVSRLSKQTI